MLIVAHARNVTCGWRSVGCSAGGDNSHEVLMDENRRLRSEVEELRNQAQEAPSARDTEQKLELYERLEKSESRILSLERQVRAIVMVE